MKKINTQFPRSIDALELLRRDEEADPILAAGVKEERYKLNLGMEIQALREKAGLTQSQLAQMIGTAQPAIARLESAEYERMSLGTLLKIAEALEVNLTIQFSKRPRHGWKRTRRGLTVEEASSLAVKA